MADPPSNAGRRGFFAYYREYATSGIHAASAAALTALIGLASFVNRWFVVLAIAVYVLPPVFLYLTAEGDRVPSVVGDGSFGGETTDTDHERGGDRRDRRDVGADSDSAAARSGPENGGNNADSPSDAATGTPTHDADRATDDTDPSGSVIGGDEAEWTEVETPTDESLLDVVATRDGAFAVGEGGVVLAGDGDEWTVAVEQGPTAESNPLRGVDGTAEGEAVWFAGDSGVLGRYADGRLTDHSAPDDRTSTWTDVAVMGTAGDERVHLVNGSGELLVGEYDGGSVSWDDIRKPGSGSSISAIAFVDSDRGHICDTNQSVYETTDAGASYEKIGIDDANTDFTGVAATDSTVVVAGGDGSVFRYDGAVWTRLRASETGLSAIDLAGEQGLAAGEGGAVCELTDGRWESVETLADADLRGVVVGAGDGERAGPGVAVGADGTILERRR